MPSAGAGKTLVESGCRPALFAIECCRAPQVAACVAGQCRRRRGCDTVGEVRFRGLRTLIAGLAMVAVAAPPSIVVAARDKDEPIQIVPTKKSGKARRGDRRADVDRSEGGTRQGVVEISLGSVVLGASTLLVGRGVWELVTSRRAGDACDAGLSDTLECEFLDPRRHGAIAAGLSFGFAGVLGLAGGFLLARGLRIRRDYRQYQREFQAQSVREARLTLMPWATVRRTAGGLSLRLRF